MKRVAVLGGGPAGALAAERLAAAGLETILLDDKLAWEKPCGGGVTWKACQRYPFLGEGGRLVNEVVLGAGNAAGHTRLRLRRPIVIYARADLNRMLLERAARAGARLEQDRVLEAERSGAGWRIRTRRGGTLGVDFCIVATGARNPLRGLGTEMGPGDAMLALGYYIPGEQRHIDIQFFAGMYGYIWLFPRCSHISAGICGKGMTAQALRKRLEDYLDARGLPWRGASFYSHLLPSLAPRAWKKHRAEGPGWLAAGDAAGLVDPITGEGIYYALLSGELAADALLHGRPEEYPEMLRRNFAGDLAFGASIAQRMYGGSFLARPVTDRMVQFARRSPRFEEVVQDLFAGTQPYLGLKRRLWTNLAGTLMDVTLPSAGKMRQHRAGL